MLRSFLAAALIAACSLATSVAAEALVLGNVSDNVKKHLARLAPLVDYLETELADERISSVEVSGLPSADAMAEAFKIGKVDLHFDCPLVAARVAQSSGAVPMVRRWKKGVGPYHSVIFVPMKSYNKTTRFDRFPGGVEASFAPIHNLLGALRAQNILDPQ